MQLRAWIKAFRLRTLPLALSCSVLGSFLAASDNAFSWPVFLLCMATTIFLQVLSNLANDLGDYQHGADDENRVGPQRAMQSGVINEKQMKTAIVSFIALSLIAGIALLFVGLQGMDSYLPLLFFLLGLGAIVAALKYTYGKNPYGYSGWGDVFVFFFFGLVGGMGTYFLHTKTLHPAIILPASALGLLATGVLNLNNIRDIENDATKGKITIPVRLGFSKALFYHFLLIGIALLLSVCYILISGISVWHLLVMPAVGLLVRHVVYVNTLKKSAKFDNELKNLALTTFLFSLLFGVSQILM